MLPLAAEGAVPFQQGDLSSILAQESRDLPYPSDLSKGLVNKDP